MSIVVMEGPRGIKLPPGPGSGPGKGGPGGPGFGPGGPGGGAGGGAFCGCDECGCPKPARTGSMESRSVTSELEECIGPVPTGGEGICDIYVCC